MTESATAVTREIYWNIVGGTLIYLFAFAAFAVVGWGVRRRVLLWRRGRGELVADRWRERLGGGFAEVFTHRRNRRDRGPGLAHLLIFYGFMGEVVATGLIAVQEWTGLHFLQGTFYLVYSLLSDGFGLIGLIGISLAIYRRAVVRPARLHSLADDWVLLGLLFLVFAQGFWLEGTRIAATELRENPGLAIWSPVGYVVALFVSWLEVSTLETLHRWQWWIHAFTAFGFLAYFTLGKMGHAIFGTLNIFFRKLEPASRLEHFDIEAALDEDESILERLGVSSLEGFTAKDLMDLDACVQCGRCEAACPAAMSGVALSPRKLIFDLRAHLNRRADGMLATVADPTLDGELGADGAERLIGDAVEEEELWGCRTCGACVQECPLHVDPVSKIIDMRRYLVMTESKMSDETQLFLKNMDDRLHPWAKTARTRDEWYRDLDVKVLGEGESAEYLFWVGCTGALVERNVKVTRAMVRVLQAAGVDFGVLGPEEVCTGDPARRVGGELTFQICAKQNIETLSEYGVKKIISTCPHCFNSFRNEYPSFGGDYEVIHHTQMIRDLIEGGRLKLSRRVDALTYHDPCYLGRQNGEYDAPREALRALSPDGQVEEMPAHRSRSLCCGAGGGYAWMDDAPSTRINHMRVKEAKACKADTVAVGCPFCLQMFEDGIGAVEPEKATEVRDLAELVADALPGSSADREG